MNQRELIEILAGYDKELEEILKRFTKTREGWHIESGDDSRFNQIVLEVKDILHDHIIDGDRHSDQLSVYANYSIFNWLDSPSYAGIEKVKGLIASVLARVTRNPMALVTIAQEARAAGKKNPEFLDRVAERLPTVIRELRVRREERPTLDVNDEYDLQDLLRSLLALEFDDIRREEWVPSYAGGSSRIDFLLPEIELALEAKMTRRGLTASKLGEELIIDIAKYERHPQCRTLYCIVYDPEGRIANPRGIENDLADRGGQITVRVSIVPR